MSEPTIRHCVWITMKWALKIYLKILMWMVIFVMLLTLGGF